jgi:outer membrane receptor protein involved in Fe transport
VRRAIAVVPLLLVAGSVRADEPDAIDQLVGEGADIAELDLARLLAIPTVESASRRKQSAFETPMAITVFEADEIGETPAGGLALLLRRAPGAYVIQTNANNYNVGLRGLNGLSNNHVLTLLDGQNTADAAAGYVPWGGLPVHPGDLERIEVLHGPGSTVYGANALSGVINLRSKLPLDHLGTEAALDGGLFYLPRPAVPVRGQGARIASGGSGYLAHGWASDDKQLGVRLSTGFTGQPGWDDPGSLLSIGTSADEARAEPRHGEFEYHAAGTVQYRPGDDRQLVARLRHAHAEIDTALAAMLDSVPLLRRDQSLGLAYEHRRLACGQLDLRGQLDARLSRVDYPFNPRGKLSSRSLAASGQADWRPLGERLIITAGLDGSLNDQSELFNASPRVLGLAAFSVGELVVLEEPRLLLNLGLRGEQHRLSDGGQTIVYRNLAPRAALVLNLADRHAVRLAAAQAFRVPSVFQSLSRFDSDVEIQPGEPPQPFLTPNPALEPTRTRSLELGYRSRRGRLSGEATGFAQRIRDVIDFPPIASVPFQYDNVGSATEVGGSLRLDYVHSEALRGGVHYTYTHLVDDDDARRPDWPAHLAGFTGRAGLPAALRATLDVNLVSAVEVATFVASETGLTVRRAEVEPHAFVDLRLARPLSSLPGEVWLLGRNLAAVARDRDDLLQYPGSAGEPIGTSFLLGITVREP